MLTNRLLSCRKDNIKKTFSLKEKFKFCILVSKIFLP